MSNTTLTILASGLVFTLVVVVFRAMFRKQDEAIRSFRKQDEALAEEHDLLIPEAETLHNAPSPANPEAVIQVRKAKAKPKKKPKAPVKPRRTPKARRTRFDRIDDD